MMNYTDRALTRSFNEAWLDTIARIMDEGEETAPRGLKTCEVLNHTLAFDASRPVLTVPERKTQYRFMAAEAHWILSGKDDLAGIAPWNERMREFSDDGESLWGAYGPRVADQLNHVLKCLANDADTRQAVITTWRPNPIKTRDTPCTVAIDFKIRNGLLHTQVFMRSSDAWLGLPYDCFTFCALNWLVCARLRVHGVAVVPGALFLTAASSHLYEPHWQPALDCVNERAGKPWPFDQALPAAMCTNPLALMTTLAALRDSRKGDPLRWWEAT